MCSSKCLKWLLLCLAFNPLVSAWALTVTVSIPPLAGMVAPLLGEHDQVEVLLKTGVSPHGFQLRPSHLRALQNSDLVLSVGGGVDAWIEKPVRSMRKPHVEMMTLSGLRVLPVREGGLWERELDEHSHSKNFPPPVVDTVDNHIWMSVSNAMLMIEAVSQQLKQLAPEQAQMIEQRKQRWLAKIEATEKEVDALLTPVKKQPYLVLHDAFQYFEKHYQLNGVGAIRLNPELPPSLKRIGQLRERIAMGKVRCVFKEPQFSEKRLQAVTSGLSVNVGTLDPMGQFTVQNASSNRQQYNQPKPYVLYDDFLKQIANAFVDCLLNEASKK